ncbi:hypothetical protein [Enterococcus asini]|uniref:hypothetical protein n=1 Tax=Enterococcus asini TaxID=57732 RepID=UPI00266C4238|nr:hypothetical protein [Enterococcus asini]
MVDHYEQWEEDAKKRTQKFIELEKRLLAFQEQYEGGNLTEEEYQKRVNQEKDFMEPQENWEPIEPIEPVPDQVTEAAVEALEEQTKE